MKKIIKLFNKLMNKQNKERAKRAVKITVREAKRVAPKAKREAEKIYHFGKEEAKKVFIEINKKPSKKR
ncbi:MAG: hypothetical protein PHT54_03695 [Candidatus Nanoarchaeia archaeon]|nr:hypothetical protein [Candidatus Nanoarchaeia archaeon]